MQRVSNAGRLFNETIIHTLIQYFTGTAFACSTPSFVSIDLLALSSIKIQPRDEIRYNFGRRDNV